MEESILEELITKINIIYSTQQNDEIKECLSLLNIRPSYYLESEIKYKSLNGFDFKDYYTSIIIKEIENRLTEEQKLYFYHNLKPWLIRYTSSNDIKIETVDNIVSNENLIFNGNVENYIINIVSSIDNDIYKTNFIEQYKDSIDPIGLSKLLSSFYSDKLKIKYLELLNDEVEELCFVILSIKDDNLKLEMYEKYKDEFEEADISYNEVISSLKRDDLKIEALEKISYNNGKRLVDGARLMYGLNNDESLLQIWNKVDLNGKLIIIHKIKDEEKKYSLLKELNSQLSKQTSLNHVVDLLYELSEEHLLDIISNCSNINISPVEMCNILEIIDNEEIKLNVLLKTGNEKTLSIARNRQLLLPETIINNIDAFLDVEKVSNKEKVKNYIQELYKTNNGIVNTIDWKLLEDKYVDTLGLDKINLIGSFKELTNEILSMNEKEYVAFYRCLNHYIQKNGDMDWQYSAYQMMMEIHFNRMDDKKIVDYIDNFNNVNIDNLLYILLNGDNYGVKSIDDINNYDKLIAQKCNNSIKNGSLPEKKDAIFIKMFGLSDRQSMLRGFRGQIKNGMLRIYNLYHQDIHLIEDESIKSLFSFLEMIIKSNSDEELLTIYNYSSEFRHVDTYALERQIKNEFLKLYNKRLLQLNNLHMNKDGLLEAGVDFSMIVTSVGAYIKKETDDFMKDWNKSSLASGHFCASYIRNDMLGTAPIPHFLYGFTNMEPYSLMLSGPNDIYSSGASFISKSYENEEYYAPDNQINKTSNNNKYKYNEMDFRRIQNGKKKQPDYILVFRRDGVIDNIEEAKKASSDWNNLPIVVVDVNLCLENEHHKVQEMLYHFYQKPTQELFNQIKTKVLNNRVTNSSFAEKLDLNELEKYVINQVDRTVTM